MEKSYEGAMAWIRRCIKSNHIKPLDFSCIDNNTGLTPDEKKKEKRRLYTRYVTKYNASPNESNMNHIFLLMGDLDRIENEIITPIEMEMKEDLDLEFKRLTIEDLFSSSDNFPCPEGKDGCVLVIEGVERLNNSLDYSGKIMRLVMPSIETSLSDSKIRWTVIFTTKECDDRVWWSNTWGWLTKKDMLSIFLLKD